MAKDWAEEGSVIDLSDLGIKFDTPTLENIPESAEILTTEPENIIPNEISIDELPDAAPQEVVEEEEPQEEIPQINQFQKFASVLFENGIFQSEEEEEEILDGEQLLARVQKEITKGSSNGIYQIVAKYGKEHEDAFRAIYIDGVNPKDYFQTQEKLKSVRDLDITEEVNQEFIVKEYYKSKGWPEARVNKKISAFKDVGELEEEAQEAHRLLVEEETQQLEKLSVIKKAQIEEQTRQKNFYNHAIGQIISTSVKDKSIDGIPFNDKEANELYDFMTTNRYTLQSGEEITELDRFWIDLKRPENFQLRAKVALLAKNNFDLSKVKQVEKSQKANDMFDFLTQKEKTEKRTNQTYKDRFNVPH